MAPQRNHHHTEMEDSSIIISAEITIPGTTRKMVAQLTVNPLVSPRKKGLDQPSPPEDDKPKISTTPQDADITDQEPSVFVSPDVASPKPRPTLKRLTTKEIFDKHVKPKVEPIVLTLEQEAEIQRRSLEGNRKRKAS
ncbi:hypothetical protein ACLX1H_000186 [Fusarium chlamydosporum]